jgi:hypothetical protein
MSEARPSDPSYATTGMLTARGAGQPRTGELPLRPSRHCRMLQRVDQYAPFGDQERVLVKEESLERRSVLGPTVPQFQDHSLASSSLGIATASARIWPQAALAVAMGQRLIAADGRAAWPARSPRWAISSVILCDSATTSSARRANR